MTDQDFDDIDLANALRRAAGTIPDVDAAFGTFQRRVRVARIRRVSVAVSSSAAVMVLGVGAFALAGRDNSPVTPADQRLPLDSVFDPTATDPGTGETGTSTTSTRPGPTGNSGNTGSPTGTTGSSGSSGNSGSSTGGSGGATSSTRPDDDGEGEGDDGENGGGGSASTSTTVRSSTSTTVAPVSKRCTSVGGSFTAVRLANSVDLRDIVPAAGFSVHETEQESSSAKVVFRSGETEVGLEAYWTGSGFTCALES